MHGDTQGPSSGSSGGGDNCDLQLKAYASVDRPEDERGIPVMVSITAPPGQQRAAVDLVVVLHVRKGYKLPEKWQELLVEAMKVVAERLDDKADRLAIVTGQSTLLPMAAGSSRVEVATDEVYKAIKSNSLMVRACEWAKKILDGRGDDEKLRRAGCVLLISNSNGDDDMDSLLTWRFRSVHAFGFRDAGNASSMHAIVSMSPGCTYAILDDEHGHVTQALAASIDRITSTVVPIEVKLKCEKRVVLSSIDAPRVSYFISYDKKVGSISAYLGGGVQEANFIVYLGNLHGNHCNDRELPKLFTLHIKRGGHKIDGEVVTVRKGQDGSKQVAAEMVRVEAVKKVANITADDKKDVHAAADELHKQWALLRNGDIGREAGEAGLLSGLTAEMQEMEARLYNNYFGLEYMLSWQSHQRWQLPLPPLFMDKQQQAVADDHLLRLEIFAAVPEMVILPLPVLVRVVAPKSGLAKRPPVDLVAVLDAKCGSTEAIRLKLLLTATELIMKKLAHKDRLAIVPAQSSSASEPAGLMEMSSETSTKVRSLVLSKLHTASANNKKAVQVSHWRGKLSKATKFVKSIKPVRSSIPAPAPMEPEGQSTATTTAQSVATGGSTKLWTALIDAVKILDGRPGEEKDRVGFVIVISDSEDDSLISQNLINTNKYTIHTFGFRGSGTRNTRALQYIASTSNGMYAVLNDADKIAEAFTTCIDKITSTIAVGTTVDISIACSSHHTASGSGPVLSRIESGRFWSRSRIAGDRKSGSIFAGTLSADTARSFLVYVDNVGEAAYPDRLSELLAVRVRFLHASSRVEEEVEGGQVVVVKRSWESEDMKFMAEIALEAVKIAGETTDPKCDRKLLADKLNMMRQLLLEGESTKVRDAGREMRTRLAGEMKKMEDNLIRVKSETETEQKLSADNLSYCYSSMLSWLSFQDLSEQPPLLA